MEIIAENEKRFNRMENKFEALKADFSEFKADMAGFKADIQTTLNNTMRWYIGTASIIIIVLKALDLLVK